MGGYASAAAHCKITSLAMEGNIAVALDDDGNLMVWDVRTGEEQNKMEKMPSGITSLAMEGDIAVAGDYDGNFKVWDVRTGKVQTHTEKMPDMISSLAM